MKQLFVSSAMVAIAAATKGCLYCRKMDKNSGALVSYSFCNQTEECLSNVWNYVNRMCREGWQRGREYDFEYCQAQSSSCPNFTSSEDKFGVYDNRTWDLGENEMCTIKMDANNGVARVIF